jgi:hypothetical protein
MTIVTLPADAEGLRVEREGTGPVGLELERRPAARRRRADPARARGPRGRRAGHGRGGRAASAAPSREQGERNEENDEEPRLEPSHREDRSVVRLPQSSSGSSRWLTLAKRGSGPFALALATGRAVELR